MNQIVCVFDGTRRDTRMKHAVVRTLQRSLQEMDIRNCEITVLVTDAKRMRQLNAQCRGKQKATDVLSFAMREAQEFPQLPKREREYLGHIVLNADDIRRQAQRYRTTCMAIAQFLSVHGMLHLLGFNHVKRMDARLMRHFEHMLCKGKVFYHDPI